MVIQTMFWVIFFRLCLWTLPYKGLKKILRFEDGGAQENHPADWFVIKNVVATVRACSRYVPRATCLTQALAARAMLRSKGQDSRLRIGVGRDEDDNFIAHAWVESGGKVVIGKSIDLYRYTMLSNGQKQTV